MVLSARIIVAPSGNFNAVVAKVVKLIPFSVKVFDSLSHVESSSPVLALLSREIANFPLSFPVKSAVSVAKSFANTKSGINDKTIHKIRKTAIILVFINVFFISAPFASSHCL